MHSRLKYYFFIAISSGYFLLTSCKKEGELTFTVPSTYRFNSPNLYEKTVYKIDNNLKKGILLSDSLGDFNRANNIISDSLNIIIRNDFSKNFIRSILFKDGNAALFEFGKLDTTAGKNLIVPTVSKESKYLLSGNNIKFEAFPEYYAELNNSFLEVNFCQEFTLRSQRVSNGNHIKRYFHKNCTETDHNKIIARIINENQGIIYDTISIERVNYIFSKY